MVLLSMFNQQEPIKLIIRLKHKLKLKHKPKQKLPNRLEKSDRQKKYKMQEKPHNLKQLCKPKHHHKQNHRDKLKKL